jgi:hypothetical protein
VGWWKPALALAIDLTWSFIVETVARPMFVGFFPVATSEANHFLDLQLIPMLWISYGVMLTGQITWLTWFSRSLHHWDHTVSLRRKRQRIRRRWLEWAAVMVLICLGVHGSITLRLPTPPDPAGVGFLLILLACDFLVIFWLPATLMAPQELRAAIPPWGFSSAKVH